MVAAYNALLDEHRIANQVSGLISAGKPVPEDLGVQLGAAVAASDFALRKFARIAKPNGAGAGTGAAPHA